MEWKHLSPIGSFTRAALGVLALAFCVTFVTPGKSEAVQTAANAKILNVVTVNYYDANGTNQYSAATSTSVTVNLVQVALTASKLVDFTNAVDSGQVNTSYVALTANSNGSDNYTLSLTEQTVTKLSGNTYTLKLGKVTDGNGSSITSGTSGNVVLGASSIVSVAAASGSPVSQVISIPAGTLNGITTGSIVVIGSTSYIVSGTPSSGTQAGYTVTGASTATGTPTSEALGTITIVKDTNSGGSNVDPGLDTGAALAGTLIEERKILQIQITGIVNSNTADGSDLVYIDSTTVTGEKNSTQLAETAYFYHVSVSINKIVHNITDPTKDVSPYVTATGKPNDVLEYTVTVYNPASGNAGLVSVSDAVPAYTTLSTGAEVVGPFLDGLGNNFATVYDGTNTVIITTIVDSETQPVGVHVGFGHVTGGIMTFFIGTGTSTNAMGGTVAHGATYTIKYSVKVN